MIVYHSSATRNTERFVAKIGLPAISLPDHPRGPFILITPTVGDGECPDAVMWYMQDWHDQCKGVIVGGNRNFGASFAGAGKELRKRFNIPVLYTFELAGTETDVLKCREGILNWLSYTQ